MDGRTTLVIAHRLSTVANADRVVVLDRGRVVQQGDHRSLLAEEGLYKRLVEKQFVAA
jgi:ATP-binding cassette subfamily B protein